MTGSPVALHVDRLLAELQPLTVVLLVLWLVTMISLPIVRRVAGKSAEPAAISAGVVMQSLLVLTVLSVQWGFVRGVSTGLAVALLAWVVEYSGSRTGFPFGGYIYTERLQPQLGHVPVVVPLAWLMMLPPSWAIAQAILGTSSGLAFALIAAAAFTAWDLFLDPQMVTWGLWRWQRRGRYFGVPLTNYLGWFVVAALMTAVLQPPQLPLYPLLFIYALMWILETIAQLVFWNLQGPGMIGALAMGAAVVAATLQL